MVRPDWSGMKLAGMAYTGHQDMVLTSQSSSLTLPIRPYTYENSTPMLVDYYGGTQDWSGIRPATFTPLISSKTRCHAPNRFGTVNMEDNMNIKWSWCEGWARRSLIIAIYRTRRLSWCKRRLLTSSSHHLHKNRQEAEETEGITSIMVWERNAIYCSPTPIPERAKKLKNWWRNKGKKRRNNVSTQMSFLDAQCRHSDILNSSTVSKAIRHVTIPQRA